MKLFQMPPNLPLTIDSVRGGAELGRDRAAPSTGRPGEPKPEVPPEPQPVVVEPEKARRHP